MLLKNKVAIVTGGASGLGKASARLLAREGAKVIIADNNKNHTKEVVDLIRAEGKIAVAFDCDVSQSAQVSQLVEFTIDQFKSIDVLMHGAGICPRMSYLEMTDDEWSRVLRINLDGTFYMTREVGKVLAKQNSGTIILISSDRGIHGSIDYAHYAASKGGMIALTKSLAQLMGKYNVTVNAINPGMTDTPLARAAVTQWQEKMKLDVLGKYSEPEEIAEIVLFLASKAGGFMTGQIIGTRMRHGA
jgi:3-oxoacyl-[acyl-carrier protein] reductase